MVDKNGNKIKTGDVVLVGGAYVQRHNGRYVVIHSPGDEGWTGADYCMHKIRMNGTPCKGVYKIAFWPLCYFTNNRAEKKAAKEWDARHATIEIIGHMEVPEELL